MKILVTGGGGYVGSILIPVLLSAGHQVRVVDIFRYGGQGLVSYCRDPGLELRIADICDESAIASALDGMDIIVHLAALVGSPACNLEPGLAVSTNIDGTAQILALRQSDQGLLLASSCSVYGRSALGHCDESTPALPTTLYARTKAKDEELVLASANSIVYRFPTAFGLSGQMRLDLLLNNLTYQAVTHGEFFLFEPEARRSFIHVTDMAHAVNFAINNWKDLRDNVYNAGHESLNLTKGDLARKIEAVTGCVVHESRLGSDPDQRDHFLSFAEIRRRGFRTSLSIDDGIREMARAAHVAALPTVPRRTM